MRNLIVVFLSFFLLEARATEPSSCPDELLERYRAGQQCWPAFQVHESVTAEPLAALPQEPPFPRDNPHTQARERLGKQLFFDPRLSASGQIACASCHDPDLNWADGRRHAFGHGRQAGHRNTPSLVNAAWLERVFWDGRAGSLEAQALASMTNPVEMNADPAMVAERIGRIPGYQEQFRDVFASERATAAEIVAAIATFVRTVHSRTSRFDRFMTGHPQALSDNEIRGLHLFRTRAGCMNCHNGPLFTDNDFHNIGLHYFGRKFQDLGRYEITGDPEDVGAFKTPGLRDVVHTRPWMHNGLFPSLRGVLNIYNAGGARPKPRPPFEDDPLFPETSELLEPLQLSGEELDQLEAFLHAISRRSRHVEPPPLP